MAGSTLNFTNSSVPSTAFHVFAALEKRWLFGLEMPIEPWGKSMNKSLLLIGL